eukprot:5419616-Pleurochrysis_carterae.AAC.2
MLLLFTSPCSHLGCSLAFFASFSLTHIVPCSLAASPGRIGGRSPDLLNFLPAISSWSQFLLPRVLPLVPSNLLAPRTARRQHLPRRSMLGPWTESSPQKHARLVLDASANET